MSSRLFPISSIFFFFLLQMFRSPILATPSITPAPVTLAELNNATAEEFTEKLSGIFEHSPWVVAEAAARRPFRNVEQMMAKMMDVIKNSGRERQLALVRAHPELAGKKAKAGAMTMNSKQEQSGAGLSNLTSAQFDEFKTLNAAYKDRFHFPFILALRDQTEKGNSTVDTILSEFRQRMRNTETEELEEALRQIGRIAQHRLKDLIQQEDE